MTEAIQKVCQNHIDERVQRALIGVVIDEGLEKIQWSLGICKIDDDEIFPHIEDHVMEGKCKEEYDQGQSF